MAWAIITIYTSKCAQVDPQQLPKTSTLYSRCKKCDIEKTLGRVGTTTIGSQKVKRSTRSLPILYRDRYVAGNNWRYPIVAEPTRKRRELHVHAIVAYPEQ